METGQNWIAVSRAGGVTKQTVFVNLDNVRFVEISSEGHCDVVFDENHRLPVETDSGSELLARMSRLSGLAR
jgi:hypothetical protein